MVDSTPKLHAPRKTKTPPVNLFRFIPFYFFHTGRPFLSYRSQRFPPLFDKTGTKILILHHLLQGCRKLQFYFCGKSKGCRYLNGLSIVVHRIGLHFVPASRTGNIPGKFNLTSLLIFPSHPPRNYIPSSSYNY